MKRLLIAIALVVVPVGQAAARITVIRSDGVLRCRVRGTGSAVTDNRNFAAAVRLVNAEPGGRGLIEIAGSVELTGGHDFTGAASIVGVTPGAQLNIDVATPSTVLSWNENWKPTIASHFDCNATAGSQFVTRTGGAAAPVEGDWVVFWDETQITGVEPHLGHGHQQSPEEIHLIEYVHGNKLWLNDFLVDGISASARGRGVVAPMVKDIVIDNLVLNWSGSEPPPDYATILKFVCCEGVHVTPRVRTTRHGPGAIWFSYCANCRCEATINGVAKLDGIYGVVVGTVNGVIFDQLVRGTRHAFTTTGRSIDEADAVTANATTDTFTATGHGLSDGMQIHFTGAAAPPTTTLTPYWVVNSRANDFQVATTPGGTAVNLTGTRSNITANREGRWGTPRNVRWEGIIYISPKIHAGTSKSRQIWDTHAEGWGLVCRADFVGVGGRTKTTYGAQSRSRNTIFVGCTFEGGSHRSITGIRLLADGCKVHGCTFNSLGHGVFIGPHLGGGPVPDNCQVTNNTFRDIRWNALRISAGDNHRIVGNTFEDCGQTQGNIPFASKSIIRVSRNPVIPMPTGMLIAHNTMPKRNNDYTVDLLQMDETDVELSGNVATGYGSGNLGIGQARNVMVDTRTDILKMSGGLSHPFLNGDKVRFTTTGTLPTDGGLHLAAATDYYVLNATSTTFKVEASQGGGAIDFTGAGTGQHSVENGPRTAVESAFDGLNTVDE